MKGLSSLYIWDTPMSVRWEKAFTWKFSHVSNFNGSTWFLCRVNCKIVMRGSQNTNTKKIYMLTARRKKYFYSTILKQIASWKYCPDIFERPFSMQKVCIRGYLYERKKKLQEMQNVLQTIKVIWSAHTKIGGF